MRNEWSWQWPPSLRRRRKTSIPQTPAAPRNSGRSILNGTLAQLAAAIHLPERRPLCAFRAGSVRPVHDWVQIDKPIDRTRKENRMFKKIAAALIAASVLSAPLL